jgi:undecaprenyl diphosphate synthase
VYKLLKYLSLNFLRPNKQEHVPVITPKPKHVAVIMDGNGRWANAQGLSRVAGHKKGVDSVKGLIRSCINHEIPYLTIFAFSSENWNRPSNEVKALMELLRNALETQTKKLNENGVRLNLLGDLDKFDPRIQKLADQAQRETSHNTKLVFSVAVNYGGRWDITQACKNIASQVADGVLSPEEVDEALINANLATFDLPDPDLFIRTSGEYRISNFMLWQAAYAEFYFTDTLWPDFDENAFTEALLKFTRRDRRYGGAKDQVEGASIESVNAESHQLKQTQSSDAVESPHSSDESAADGAAYKERKSA